MGESFSRSFQGNDENAVQIIRYNSSKPLYVSKCRPATSLSLSNHARIAGFCRVMFRFSNTATRDHRLHFITGPFASGLGSLDAITVRDVLHTTHARDVGSTGSGIARGTAVLLSVRVHRCCQFLSDPVSALNPFTVLCSSAARRRFGKSAAV